MFFYSSNTDFINLSCYITYFRNFTHLFSAPSRIISDRGRCFSSFEFKQFGFENNIDLHFIAHCAGKANSQVERVMQVLKNIRTVIETEESKSWQDSLGDVQLASKKNK